MKCRLRVLYSDGERVCEKYVKIPESSTKKERIKALNKIKDCKQIITYWIEDVHKTYIVSYRLQFNRFHNIIK